MNPTSSFGQRRPAPLPADDAPAASALAYAERGWCVLPLWWPTSRGECACGLSDCESVGKHPIRRLVPHGLRDASNSVETVRTWWRSSPHANVGIRTGTDGPVVLDVDGDLGELALRGLVAHHGAFQALWVRTGSGWHAYFAHPGTPVPNSAGRVGDGLDVRGDGGYVVAPPSLHANLGRYRWHGARGARTGSLPVGGLPAMPDWLLQLVAPPARERAAPQPVWLRSTDVAAYAAAAIADEVREVGAAPRGQRNHQLNRAAFKLGQLVGAGLVDGATVTNALVTAGLAAGPGERKIRSTVRGAIRAGMCHPRRVELHTPAGPEVEPC
jgi:Bifunctional DNA primase/polymerase, N-terminal